MEARTKLLTVFTVVGGLMAIASLGWACTALVGPTEITDTDMTPSATNEDLTGDDTDDTPGVPAASPGDDGGYVTAIGFALEGQEPSDCGPGCDYELVSVSTPAAGSCHFNQGEEDESSDATESSSPLGTELNGTVDAPNSAGPAVVCFRSKELNVNGAPAAGTSGAPFLVLN